MPFGFCSGGFTSTSSLRSGQRGSTEVERRPLPKRPIISSQAPSRFYPRGSEEVCRLFLRKPFGFSVRRHGSRLNRWLLSSNIVSPRRSPILSLVTVPVRTATGGGLYARVRNVSSIFSKKIFSTFPPDFSYFRRIQKLHQQPISTGGNFMPDSCAKLQRHLQRGIVDSENYFVAFQLMPAKIHIVIFPSNALGFRRCH